MRRLAFLFSLIAAILPLAASRVHGAPVPGVALTIESPDGKQSDCRDSRLIALSVPKDSAPSPFIPAGAFRATFHGFLNLPIRDQYTFRAAGRGEIELILNGQSVLKVAGDDLSTKSSELVKLKKGANEITLNFTAPGDGDALLRLSWAPRDKPYDPIPPMALTHEVDAALQTQSVLREGCELFVTRRCMRCHQLPDTIVSRDGAMPELAIDAPNLDDVGSRLNAQWMAQWIADPKAMRSDTTMPRVFAREDAKETSESVAADIAAYLATRTDAKSQAGAEIDHGQANIIAGERLFLSLGCIACHTVPPAVDNASRISLRFVHAKFKPAALLDYLKKPEAHFAWTRMPNFALSDDDATKLAAFLLKTAPADALGTVDLTTADPERGKLFFSLAGCMKCHSPETKSISRAKPVAQLTNGDWSVGCLSSDAASRARAPDFGFTDSQRDAIRSFAKTDWTSLTRDSDSEAAERQIRLLNCAACHTRDAQQDTWSTLAPEIAALQQGLPAEPEAKSEQIRPLLTWTGEKLHTEWMAAFIGGQIDYKPRPWLKARMPAFPARANLLARGLTLEHGLPIDDPPEPPVDQNLAAIGRTLAGRNGGLSCNQCHAINQSPAFVPFDSPSINFMYVHERVRKDYFERWTRSPSRYMPGTKMPTYADPDGKSGLKNILDGDAHQQFEAIWQYLRAGRDIVAPE